MDRIALSPCAEIWLCVIEKNYRFFKGVRWHDEYVMNLQRFGSVHLKM